MGTDLEGMHSTAEVSAGTSDNAETSEKQKNFHGCSIRSGTNRPVTGSRVMIFESGFKKTGFPLTLTFIPAGLDVALVRNAARKRKRKRDRKENRD